MIQKNRNILRYILISAVIIIVVVSGFSIWVSLGYKNFIKVHLNDWVAKATDSIYSASIQDIRINFLTRSLTVTGIKLCPDTNSVNYHKETGSPNRTIVTIAIPKLQLYNIEWSKLISEQELVCGQVYIWQGKALIITKFHLVDSQKIEPQKKNSPAIKKIFASVINIIEPDITYHLFGKNNDSFFCSLKGGKGMLYDWLLDPAQKDTTRFLLAKSCIIDSSGFSIDKLDRLYTFNTTAFYFNTNTSRLFLRNASFHPIVDNETFYRITGHRQTICTVDIPTLNFIDLDWLKLMRGEELYATAIGIADPALSLYYSYLPPPEVESKIKLDPIHLLHNAPFMINIKEVSVKNARLKYAELNEQSMMTGVLLIDRADVHISNITNIASLIAINKNCLIKTNAILMHKSIANASMALSLNDDLGAFTINAGIKNLEANQIRELGEALDLMKIATLNLESMEVHVQGNQDYTQEEQTALYTDLKVELEKRDDSKIKAKPIPSFIANAFFIYPSNPSPGKEQRRASTYMVRDPKKAFVPMIIENIKCGAKNITVKNEKIAPIKHDKNERPPKKGFFKRLFGKQ